MKPAKKVGRLFARILSKKLHTRYMHTPTSKIEFSVNLVSSWDTRCGIATYSAFLAQELKKNTKVYITGLPKRNPLTPYFWALGHTAGHSGDIVHVQFEYGLFSSLRLGKRTLTAFASLPFYVGLATGNRRVITTLHEPRKTITASAKTGLFYTKLLDKLMFSVSDLIIVHTHESLELLKTVYGVDPSKLRVIPHGTYQKPTLLDKNECKRKFGLQGKTVLTVLGFVTPKKGADLVIPLLEHINSNVQLVIAGGPQTDADAQFIEELTVLAQQHHCMDRVTFTGYLPDLAPIINATDIAVLPYRSVTDSGILHILISYGVPVITSDLKAFSEIYQEYGCLELFKTEDSSDLLVKIQTLLSDEALRDSLKDKCKAMWNATKWSTIAQKHLETYREVLFRSQNE
jgi:glycosyltransferase involved in cell wall biosynthesis